MAESREPELDGDSVEQQPTSFEEKQKVRRRILELGQERINLGLDPLTGEEQKPFSQVGEEGRKRAENRKPRSIFETQTTGKKSESPDADPQEG